MLVAIINPASGHNAAEQFFADHVLPLLDNVDHVLTTNAAGHAEQFIRDLPDPLTVVLGSGDGTLHEIINALPNRLITFVLVPCGTANALYASLFPPKDDQETTAYKLQSVQAFINKATPVHLSLASTSISGSPTASLSSVVVSTSLHASILHHSEALRQTHPGLERFKIAAEQNSTKWYKSRANILPIPSRGLVEIYDPKSNKFIPHPDSTTDSPALELHGPFTYFLSTVNIDRLEPQFRISPLARAIPPPPATCDIVVLRPLRDPSIAQDDEQSRVSYVPKVWKVLGGAYQDGAHIQFTYAANGEIETAGDGPPVIEYYRAGGWEWVPDDQDPDAHLVCADGAILHIPDNGRAACTIDAIPHTFSVYGPV
ncbi:hypothetical protein CVT25_012294 [Psilocybe cyanescens]|uniref:DAGKc domain-containing protein n=1 Tax=Psilocybe cyanescens TaxID=93625 RepID=A0A409XH91_PSICY|nr:hypothetical protein CVT25_012294 [Psilocybe cyanescens]